MHRFLQICIVFACQVGGWSLQPSLSARSRGRPVLAAARPPKRTEVVVSAEVAPATAPAPGAAVQLALCCAIGSFCSLDRVVMGVAIIPMAADLGFSETTKGLIAAAFSLGYGLGIAPAGALVSKTGAPRRTLGAPARRNFPTLLTF